MILRLTGFLRTQRIPILGFLFVAAMVGMLLHFARLQRELVASVALDNAKLYSLALSETMARPRAKQQFINREFVFIPLS